MKKTIAILFVFSTLISAFFYLDTSKYNIQDYYYHLEFIEYSSKIELVIPIDYTQEDKNLLYQNVQSICDDENAILYALKINKTKFDYYISFLSSNAQLPATKDYESILSKFYNDHRIDAQIDLINVKATASHYYFHSFNSLQDVDVIGVYIISENDLTTLANTLKEKFELQIRWVNLESHQEQSYFYLLLYSGRINYLVLINIIIFMLLLLYLSLYSKQISIKKMFGLSSIRIICKEMFLTLLISMCVNILLLLIITLYWYNGIHLFSLEFLFISSITLFIQFMLILLYLILCSFIISRFKVSALLKNNRNINDYFLLLINGISKFVLLIIIANTILVSVSKTLKLYHEEKYKMEYLNIIKHYVRLDTFKDNLPNDRQLMGDIYFKTNDALINSDSIYIDAVNYQIDYNDTYNSSDILAMLPNAVRINENFVSNFEIKNSVGTPITFNQHDFINNPTILIPERYKDDMQIQYIIHSFQNYQIIYIQNNQSFFAFNSYVSLENKGYIEDAIFVIDGQYDNLKFYIKINLDQDIQLQIDDFLISNDILPVYNFLDPTIELKDYLIAVRQQFLESILQLGFIIFAFIILLYQTIFIYIRMYKRKIMVQKLHGFSVFKRYYNLLIFQALIYISVLLFIKLYNQFYYLSSTIRLLFLVDIALSFVIVQYLESMQISKLLKSS